MALHQHPNHEHLPPPAAPSHLFLPARAIDVGRRSIDGLFAPSRHIAAVSAILFKTLRLFRTLRDKGHVALEQAEALAEALGDAAQDDLATKAGLAALESRPEAKIPEVKAHILKWMVGASGSSD
jgi:hypothetical protein